MFVIRIFFLFSVQTSVFQINFRLKSTLFNFQEIISYSNLRNTTKLKQILLKYNLDLAMEEEDLLKMTLVDKTSGRMQSFEHASYSQLISKAYSFMLKELRKELSSQDKDIRSARLGKRLEE